MNSESFDLIRPYYDSEIKQAVSRILQYDGFRGFLQKFLYGSKYEEGVKIVENINSVHEFQVEVSSKFFELIIAQTIKSFKVNGLENLDKSKSYLFISTHRDIVLDSALLQIALYSNGFDTTRSAIGNNLVPSKLLEEVAKMNKMFLVIRDGSVREMLDNSLILSSYIRKSITEDNQSVWIAQRNGRTKDGNDQTQQGLLKMLAQSNNGLLIGGLQDLNIVPVVISYEYESCDALKAREVVLSRCGTYKKEPGEDFKSINTGIMQNKGCVEVTIGTPINELLNSVESCRPANDMIKDIAALIDKQIFEGYKLWKTNYMAADMLSNGDTFKMHYSDEQRVEFESYIQKLVDHTDVDRDEFKHVLLSIYANPVYNKLNLINS